MTRELSAECKQWLDEQENEFMKPCCDYFTEGELTPESCGAEFWDDDGCDDAKSSPGYYARLSAPGYLDCTDWLGPYDSAEEALEALYETYGDDC